MKHLFTMCAVLTGLLVGCNTFGDIDAERPTDVQTDSALDIAELDGSEDLPDAMDLSDEGEVTDCGGSICSSGQVCCAETCATPDAPVCTAISCQGTDACDPPMLCVAGYCQTPGTPAGISASHQSTCVIRDGEVVCWGQNQDDWMRKGTTGSFSMPGSVVGVSDAIEVDVGDSFACARTTDNSIGCWGRGSEGQMGTGQSDDGVHDVQRITLPGGTSQVSTGGTHACAVVEGSVYCWGDNSAGGAGAEMGLIAPPTGITLFGSGQPLTNVEEVAVGNQFACARTTPDPTGATSNIWCWGRSGSGQLGSGLCGSQCFRARAITNAASGPLSLRQISAGNEHVCGVDFDDQVWCWGGNGTGKANPTHTQQVAVAERLLALAQDNASVYPGQEHTCALKLDGSVQCWGDNDSYQRGTGDFETVGALPSDTQLEMGAVALTVGNLHSCAIDTAGSTWCWGDNDFSALGEAYEGALRAPTLVEGSDGSIDVVAGGQHSCQLRSGGVECWGYNNHGELGDQSVPVPRLDRSMVAAASSVGLFAGTHHTCAVNTGSGLLCWGDNHVGQIDGTANSPVLFDQPVGVPTDRMGVDQNAAQVAAGPLHNCAVLSDDTVRCWGWGVHGANGDGTTDSRTYPVTPVETTTGGTFRTVLAIDVGGFTQGPPGVCTPGSCVNHTCAVRDPESDVFCWGDNSQGQLGDDSAQQFAVPTKVDHAMLTGMTRVCTGARFSCAASDTEVHCWGTNTDGVLGVPLSTIRSPTPLPITGFAGNIEQLECGGASACVQTTTGLFCWGRNLDGELGLGDVSPGNVFRAERVSFPDTAQVPTRVSLSPRENQGHGCAIVDNRTYCWGRTRDGRLGSEGLGYSPTPLEVALPMP